MTAQAKKPGRIKSAILNYLGIPISLTDSAFWSAWNSSVESAGQPVNEKTVMSLSAAWACMRLIAETASTLPLKVYERTPTGRKPANNHPLYSILHNQPNAYSTPVTFWESMVTAIGLRGNGFAEQKELGGRLVALDFLIPSRLTPKDKAGKVWVYRDPNGTSRDIPWGKIFHIPGYSLDGRWGVSVIAYGASIFGGALAASTAANSAFKNGLLPKVYFTLDRVLQKQQRDDFRESLKEVKGAINAGESPLLEGGMDAKAIGINPKDAQLLESRAFSVEEVCRWFRVDPSMVGHGQAVSNFGTGLEQKLIAFLTFTLRPWLVRIEQAINTQLLSPVDRAKYYVEFSIEGLLRADSPARAQFYSVLVNNGIMTRDEVRVLENLSPRGGNADQLTVQSAMTTIDNIGKTNQSERAGAALAAWLKQFEEEKNVA